MEDVNSSQPSYLHLLLDESDSDEIWDCAMTSKEFHDCAKAVEQSKMSDSCDYLWDMDVTNL